MINRIHIVISAAIATVFIVIVQIFASPLPVFRFLVPAFILYLLAVAGYNYWWLKFNQQFNFWLWVRTPLFLLAWFGLFFMIPSGLGRGLFLLTSLPIITFFESLVGNNGQQLGWNEFLLTMIALLLSLFGFSYYFMIPGVIYLALVFTSVVVVVRASFELVPHESLVKWVAALALGLFTTELFWAVSFLPLHYSVLAVFVFNALYVLWIIYYHYLYKTLSRKQITFHLILALVLAVVIFMSTPWTIQS